MHKPESVIVNKTHEIVWDFEIPTDHLILDRRQDLVIITRKRKLDVERPQSENKRTWTGRQILGSCKRTKKAKVYEGDSNTDCCKCTWNDV